MTKSKLSHKKRLELFDDFITLKKALTKVDLRDWAYAQGITKISFYRWYGGVTPFGRQGSVLFNSSLYYVVGALLGDGCLYRHKFSDNLLILTGDESFCTKAYVHFLACCDRPVQKYPVRSKNVFTVRTNNYGLAILFDKFRNNILVLEKFLSSALIQDRISFLEGFFDAEGCVKIINDKARKVPKICLDICNTRKEWLDCCQKVCDELRIRTSYSS